VTLTSLAKPVAAKPRVSNAAAMSLEVFFIFCPNCGRWMVSQLDSSKVCKGLNSMATEGVG